jgi:mannose-P-dolichol utilization defect protein 1
MWANGSRTYFQVFNYLFGSLSRIFTTLQEVDDKLILYGFIAGFSLNLILACQMIYYWNAPVAAGPVPVRTEKRVETVTEVRTPAAASTGVSSSPSGRGPSTRRRG